MQPIHINTDIVSSNLDEDRVYKLCDKVCQWFATGLWVFFPGTHVSSTNKTDRHDITEILLEVALNTKHQPNQQKYLLIIEPQHRNTVKKTITGDNS